MNVTQQCMVPDIFTSGGSDVEPKKFNLGDTVRLKKKHPCGSWEWIVTRMGADIKIKCTLCGHQVMMPRSQFEKKLVAVKKEHSVD